MTDTVIVRDEGFVAEDFTGVIAPASDGIAANRAGVDLLPSDDVAALATHLDRLAMIRSRFPVSRTGAGSRWRGGCVRWATRDG